MSDTNKVWLTGVATTQPVMTQIGGKTPITYFTLEVKEQFRGRDGLPKTKSNLIRIESLGRQADSTAKKVKKGKRYSVDGYIRCDEAEDKTLFRIRTYAVYDDTTLEGVSYREAVKQVMSIVKTSRDKEAALERLEELII